MENKTSQTETEATETPITKPQYHAVLWDRSHDEVYTLASPRKFDLRKKVAERTKDQDIEVMFLFKGKKIDHAVQITLFSRRSVSREYLKRAAEIGL